MAHIQQQIRPQIVFLNQIIAMEDKLKKNKEPHADLTSQIKNIKDEIQ
jgi:hypothetical protein